jgi:release factor glutamine methyltransferase
MPSGIYEPSLALDGGESGLDKIFRLCCQVGSKLGPGGCLLMEVGMGQSPAVTDLLNQLYPAANIQVIPDLAGIGRVVKMVLQ